MDYLHRKFGQQKVGRLLKYFQRWGTGALVVSTVLPLPFPTSAFFAIAGALDYPLRTFILIVGLGRAVRYGAIATIASHYGRRFVVGLRHLMGGHSGLLPAIAAAVVIAITAAMVLRKRLQSSRPLVKTDAA